MTQKPVFTRADMKRALAACIDAMTKRSSAVTVEDLYRVDRSAEPASVPTPLQVLRSRVEKDTQKEVARSLDISAQYLCDVVNGRREVSDALADKLGYQRIITFMRKP